MKKRLLQLAFCIAVTAPATSINAQPPGPPKPPPSPEEQIKFVLEKIEKELTLTASQKEKIKMAYKDFFRNMEDIRKKEKQEKHESLTPLPPPPIKKEDMDHIVGQRDEKIKGVLNAAQYKKYQEIERSLRPLRPR